MKEQKPKSLGIKKFKALTDSASELFAKSGLKKTSIEEICKVSEVSKVSFYKEFNDKLDIAKYIFESKSEYFLKELNLINKKKVGSKEQLFQLFKLHDKFMKIVGSNFLQDISEITDFSKDFHRLDVEFNRLFKKVYKQAQKSGEIKKVIPYDVVLTLIETIHGLSQNEKIIKAYPNPEKRDETLWTFFWEGFGESI
jgi:AcrR family transcriptional regulator